MTFFCMLLHMYLFTHLQTLGNNQSSIYTIGGNEFLIKSSLTEVNMGMLTQA